MKRHKLLLCITCLLVCQLSLAQGVTRLFEDLSGPKHTDETVFSWVLKALGVSYSFHYENVDRHFEYANCFYGPNAFESYYHHIDESGMLAKVIEKHFNMSAIATSKPTILKRGRLDNRYAWLVKIPLRITLEKEGVIEIHKIDLDLIISRIISTSDCNEPLSIIQFSQKPIMEETSKEANP